MEKFINPSQLEGKEHDLALVITSCRQTMAVCMEARYDDRLTCVVCRMSVQGPRPSLWTWRNILSEAITGRRKVKHLHF